MRDINELSERELEILHLVATGASNKQIAHQLSISANTVKVHLRNIFSKIEVNSRTEAAMYAVSAGLVEPVSNPAGDGFTVLQGDEGGSMAVQDTAAIPVEGARNRRLWWISIAAIFLVIFALGAFLLGRQGRPAAGSQGSPAQSPRWVYEAGLQIPRKGLGVAAYENQIYAIGGETPEGVTDSVERYNPGRNQWQKLSPIPVALADVSAAVIGGEIYVPGGRMASGQLSDQLEVYNIFEDRWETRKVMPVALSAYALVPFEGKLYVFGGWDGSRFVNNVYEYDPSADDWSEQTPMPTARGYAGAAVAGGKIYVIGGFDGKKALAVNETYLPERDLAGEISWSKAKALPQARYAMGIASLADIVHVVGGKGDKGVVLTPLDYFPQSDEWQMIQSPFQETWSSLGLVPLETRLHAVGGELDGKPTGMTLSYQAIYTISIPLVH